MSYQLERKNHCTLLAGMLDMLTATFWNIFWSIASKRKVDFVFLFIANIGGLYSVVKL